MPAPLFDRYPSALQTEYSDLKQRALGQDALLIGTPGSVYIREVNGREHFYRQFDDAEGKKGAEHIGAVDDADAVRRAEAVRERIAATNGLVASTRMLAQLGYVRTDARTQAVLVACANAGLFRGGAVAIGSHALGALLNDLGVRVAAFQTHDVDIARPERLKLATEERLAFAQILERWRIPFRPVPSLDRKGPSTVFVATGKKHFRVDLVAPASGNEVEVRAVPELDAHATALPYLRYLLSNPFDSVILGRSSAIPVKVPRPERLAWHKMAVSELRHETSDKKRKDVDQASVLFAVLTEDEPAALEDARKALPTSLVSKVRRAAPAVEARLVAGKHERARELLRELL